MNESEFLTASAVSRRLDITPGTFLKAVHDGRVKADSVLAGHTFLFRADRLPLIAQALKVRIVS